MLLVDWGDVKHRTFVAILTVVVLLAVLIPLQPAWAAPAISVSPASGAAGTRVEISGTNFDSYVGDYLSIFFGDQEIASSPVVVSAGGQFQVSFDVPDDVLPEGVIVSVKGSLDSVLAAVTFTVPPVEIELNKAKTTIGTTVTATGEGFYADRYVNFLFVYGDTEISLGNILSGPTGEYQYEFTVPMSPAGVQQVIARNDKGDQAITGLEILPSAVVTPSIGAYEDTIAVEGIGFSSGSPVTVSFGTTMPVAQGQANAIGSVESVFGVPELTSGIYDLQITDVNGYAAQLQFTITAGIRLNHTTGYIGMPVIISGTGYSVGVTVSVYYDDVRVALATADELGSFSATFEVPASISGEHSVSATTGSTVRQLVFSVESEPPSAPKRLQPLVNNEDLPDTGFIWELVDDNSQPVTYTLQIATDDQFTDVVLEKTGLIAPQYDLSSADRLPSSSEGSPYYWRVNAVDAASNEGGWSTVGSFHWTESSLSMWVIIVLIVAGVIVVGFLVYWMIRRRAGYEED